MNLMPKMGQNMQHLTNMLADVVHARFFKDGIPLKEETTTHVFSYHGYYMVIEVKLCPMTYVK